MYLDRLRVFLGFIERFLEFFSRTQRLSLYSCVEPRNQLVDRLEVIVPCDRPRMLAVSPVRLGQPSNTKDGNTERTLLSVSCLLS